MSHGRCKVGSGRSPESPVLANLGSSRSHLVLLVLSTPTAVLSIHSHVLPTFRGRQPRLDPDSWCDAIQTIHIKPPVSAVLSPFASPNCSFFLSVNVSSCSTLPLFASLFFNQLLRLDYIQESPPLPVLIDVPVVGSVEDLLLCVMEFVFSFILVLDCLSTL